MSKYLAETFERRAIRQISVVQLCRLHGGSVDESDEQRGTHIDHLEYDSRYLMPVALFSFISPKVN